MYSLPTVNWLRFPAGVEDGRPPAPEWPLAAILDGAAAAGFPAVGIDDYTASSYVAAGGRIEDLGEELRGLGLRCTDVGVLPLATADVLEVARRLARLAAATGAGVCLAAHYAPCSFAAAARDLQASAEILAGAGATIALEFVAYGPLKTIGEAAELCDAVGWDCCRLLVDTWHVFRGEQPLSLLRALGGDRIGLVHVNDGAGVPAADAVFEGRFARLPVGEGAFALSEFAAALTAAGYRGAVSSEVLSAELRDRPPGEGARRLMRALRDHWESAAR